ncbi:transcription factor HES-5-like [Nerophis lumbriciformis]|uniref:transcription factor HES-5-like n=1 Tax=Nerophis lumbriciformis TaxID=546530 RepID=UPI002ADF7E4A|nr:transcription factor HES-5-like [Nerophis lumbriciformis]
MAASQQHATLTHKLRKPLVEKLRRERINGSIQQLKSLLAPEFLTRQPDSKLEKADILEMTVCLLRRLKSSDGAAAFHGGYSRCAREVAHFLSEERARTHILRLGSACEEEDSSPLSATKEEDWSPLSATKEESSAPWRPW